MKKIFLLLIIGVFLSQCTPKISDVTTGVEEVVEDAVETVMTKEAFRNDPPVAGPAPVINVKDANNFTLDNGLKVIVSQNNKLPVVSFQVFVDVPPIIEGDQAGAASIAGQLMGRGTTSKTKAEIDEAVDFLGARLSTYSSGLFGSSLKKHTESLMAIASDVLLNPSFPQDEFEKIKTQTLSGLASQKDDPNAIAGNVRQVLNFGKDHPYGEIETEETIGKINLQTTKNYYNNYLKPNIGYLTIVGDITPEEAQMLAEKYFGGWSKGSVNKQEFSTPIAPDKTQVDFVSKAGAVQSVINVTYPIELKPGTPDVVKARVLNTILGGGFGSRLFQNLREDKAYTYGAYSSLSNDPLIGSFNASASVRNEVTAESVKELLFEINRLRTEKVEEEDLNSIKNYITGSFARSLESPETVARFARNLKRYNMPADYYKNYLTRLNAVTAEDVMEMAQKYLKPENAHILVVGNKGEVAEGLAEFGEINYYDNYGNKLVIETSAEAANMTAEKVIANYIKAIGGEDKLKAVKDITINMAADMMGQTIDAVVIQKSPNMSMMKMSMMGNVVQEQVFDGEKGKSSAMGQTKMMSEEEVKTAKKQSILFPELMMKELGNTAKLIGTENINGANAYQVDITDTDGKTTSVFFDATTFLKIRDVNAMEAQGQTMTITNDHQDYQEVDGVLLPYTRTTTGAAPVPIVMKVKEIKINSGVEASVFKIE